MPNSTVAGLSPITVITGGVVSVGGVGGGGVGASSVTFSIIKAPARIKICSIIESSKSIPDLDEDPANNAAPLQSESSLSISPSLSSSILLSQPSSYSSSVSVSTWASRNNLLS